ncbi:MAG: hypothetical protein FWD31_13850 [Planctomycetaceae bacterium]|nr:hypothetical protein [Planctomycetaceae bacterium]
MDKNIFNGLANPLLRPDFSRLEEQMEEDFQERTRLDDEAVQRDTQQTLSLEKIVEMMQDSSKKDDERHKIDRRIAVITLIAAVMAVIVPMIPLTCSKTVNCSQNIDGQKSDNNN